MGESQNPHLNHRGSDAAVNITPWDMSNFVISTTFITRDYKIAYAEEE